ncbi:UNVERIFIED_CONTAM: Cysteine proteinase RD21A [Sesamum angustifolium]|uniref:Cysteine proteinase RD21A n=1 Tax=Sesamum angustifolium TaxID=2727405 RepID=A0AAW2LVG1_9LAMI
MGNVLRTWLLFFVTLRVASRSIAYLRKNCLKTQNGLIPKVVRNHTSSIFQTMILVAGYTSRQVHAGHSTTGAVEGINKIVTGSLISLSEQELIDCDRSYNDGCGGGLMDYAYQFIIKNKGIDSEKDYPYRGREGTCNKEKLKKHVVTIDSYADIPAKNEKKLQQAVATQPVSVGICGSEASFQLYSGGIFTGPCSASLDHAVLIVGYDSKDGKDYWIIKNSWGRSWGMDGYMHMQRNTGNGEGLCGINMLASYPIKTSPNPPPSPSPGPVRSDCEFYSSTATCQEKHFCKSGG